MADQPKPPYVRFEIRPVEDREASIAEGHYVGKDVIYAIVTPAGSKDSIEKEVNDWLKNIEEGVKQERIPEDWLGYYRRRYDDFVASRETPENGTPIMDWPSVSPSKAKTLLDLNIRTVEQLAEANEETLGRIGMGAVALREKARAWLDSASATGKLAEELNALRTENAELKARDEERETRFKALEAQVAALTKDKEDA